MKETEKYTEMQANSTANLICVWQCIINVRKR